MKSFEQLDVWNNDCQYDGDLEVIFKETLSHSEAEQVINLQVQAKRQIQEEVNELSETGLQEKSPLRQRHLYVGMIMRDGCIRGYGYGYLESKGIYYFDTIYISEQLRNSGAGKYFLCCFLNYVKENVPNIILFKAITQVENTIAIRLLESLNFSPVSTQ